MPYEAFQYIFCETEEELYDYVRACLSDPNCDLTTKEYESSWVYYLLKAWKNDKKDPRSQDAKHLLFDIKMMSHN